MHALRGLQEHAHRRKYWDRAFSPKALSEYQVQVKECTDLFIQRLESASAKGPVQMDHWCTFVAFDISWCYECEFCLREITLTHCTCSGRTRIRTELWRRSLLRCVPFERDAAINGVAYFSTSQMLESGKPHFYQTFIESAMKALATFSEIPWIMPVLTMCE